MKCSKPFFIDIGRTVAAEGEGKRPELPDSLTDYLTGAEIPFSNRDNIRQKIVRFLVEERGYLKADIGVHREILFETDGEKFRSPVDIAIAIGGRTLAVWKCSSGSLVSRERQIIATARLLEDYVVPFSAVTNGQDLEFLDSCSEKIIGCGFEAIPSRQDLLKKAEGFPVRRMKNGKIIYEQRILSTYDSIACPSSCSLNGPS
jgi:Type I restriction enzyme R protein N terminus (HSDR_N)